jgi:hypothetical protein
MDKISVTHEVIMTVVAFAVTMAFFVAIALLGLAILWAADGIF